MGKEEKLAGGTCDYAEIIVDYEKDQQQIIDVAEDTLWNKLMTGMYDWLQFLFFPTIIIEAIIVFCAQIWPPVLVWVFPFFLFYIIVCVILSTLSFNKKLDYKIKKWHALQTGNGPKNRLIVKDFKTKEFIIYNTHNIAVDYEATGDVKDQLSKVWIKQENLDASHFHQASVEESFLLEKGKAWNVHFFFKEIPKSGRLSVRYI